MTIRRARPCRTAFVIASRAKDFERQLTERGYNPIGVDLSELLLGGGGVKCCTLELRR